MMKKCFFNTSWLNICKRKNKQLSTMGKNKNKIDQDSRFEDAEEKVTSAPEEVSSEDVVSGVENESESGSSASVEPDSLEKQVTDLQSQVEKEKKEYLFLMAEFDNFRKRTLKEKSEIIKNAGENVLKGLLPIMDDFERGLKAAETSGDSEAMKEGMSLIYNKLKKYLAQNGVKEFDPSDDTFDADRHEAISVVPVPDEDKKGKILDTVEKGYMINDKVLRHAKVVVAQ